MPPEKNNYLINLNNFSASSPIFFILRCDKIGLIKTGKFVLQDNPLGVTPRGHHQKNYCVLNLNNFSTGSLIFDLKVSLDNVY